MPHYRVYSLDEGGHIRAALDLTCENDDEALARTSAIVEAIEIWQAKRLVARRPGDTVHVPSSRKPT